MPIVMIYFTKETMTSAQEAEVVINIKFICNLFFCINYFYKIDILSL